MSRRTQRPDAETLGHELRRQLGDDPRSMAGFLLGFAAAMAEDGATTGHPEVDTWLRYASGVVKRIRRHEAR